MGEEKALRTGGKDVTGFWAWEEAKVPRSNLRQQRGGRPLHSDRSASLPVNLSGLSYSRNRHKPRASKEETLAPSSVPRGPAQEAGKSAASSRCPAPSRPPHSRCSRPWRPLLSPDSGPGLPPLASPKASQSRPRPQPQHRPPAAAATADPASPPGSASRRRTVLRSTHSAGRTRRRNKVPASPTAARMRMWSRAHLGPAHPRLLWAGPSRLSCRLRVRKNPVRERLVPELSNNAEKPQEECALKNSR